ncbi:RNA polymerase factor sigma-54 [Carboxydothermus hydrogenoformans]|uniref:RNA polymerase sigma-54 factor n=1 Tax=Carboxydothermus hydrogenoformans (strain ATCC BAA-161 / DSM 6008 / Z-2901) TaxID=246194 RepID=Q3AFD3_CARHZ|nr:RNA polymerase factor sigma-54 [Carboxydothermus hydrogenoformans]ABB15508.1 RNA polymerase sigma-54 factor [Carboxydothermus hydrogenoformans Z-2901]
MPMDFGLNLEQTQKLVLTPELKQAITILQLNTLELVSFIEQQVETNPLLEIEICEDKEENELGENEEYQELREIAEYFADSSDLGMGLRQEDEERKGFEPASSESSLWEHLYLQLHLLNLPQLDNKIGEFIIGNIDENGYLTCPVEEISERLKVEEEEVVRVLKIIQTFDPPGVGARGLLECLLIQAEQKNILTPLLKEIISNYLPDLAQSKYLKVANRLGVTVEEVYQAMDIIKSLDPKPGRNFATLKEVRYVVPDITVEKVESEYIILVNDSLLPRLNINKIYQNILKQKDYDEKTKKYVEKKLNQALWLIKSIEQRRFTLYRVARFIVDYQREFLEYGLKYLKPLTLKQVAKALNLHESTISRACANKYMATPRGTFEMKYFFASALESGQGGFSSSTSIKAQIKELIARENPQDPLSDQRIADILTQRGVKISRRTVAKYREEMGILAAAKRRKV